MNVDTSKISFILSKLKKKDPVLFTRLQKKITQIAFDESLEHFKNLQYRLIDYKRIQVGSFILFFRLEGEKIVFVRLKHHDDAYRR